MKIYISFCVQFEHLYL